jgi:hypothetical protein
MPFHESGHRQARQEVHGSYIEWLQRLTSARSVTSESQIRRFSPKQESRRFWP